MSNIRWLADKNFDTPPSPPELLVHGKGCDSNIPVPPELATNTALVLPGVSLEARDLQAMTVDAYQTQMAYPAIQRNFRGLIQGVPIDDGTKSPPLPDPAEFGYARGERDENMGQIGVGTPQTSRVQWLAGPPSGRLGANPPVKFVQSAWDFANCRYTVQAGDTIDGIGQFYLKTPAGFASVHPINIVNLSTPCYPQGADKSMLKPGCVINMPKAACDYAKTLIGGMPVPPSQQCVGGGVWSDALGKCVKGCPDFPCNANGDCGPYQRCDGGICVSNTPECPETDGHSITCYGDQHPGVLAWNKILVRDAAISGATFTPDDVFGDQTLAATLKWQAAKGLATDGVVGPLTWLYACGKNLPGGKPCKGQLDCAADEKCLNGKCVKLPPCEAGMSRDLTTGNCACGAGTTWSESKKMCLPLCAAGQDPTKVNCACAYDTEWVPAAGKCLPPCPAGQTRNPKTGLCAKPVTAASSSGSDAGLLILGLGAVVALALSFAGRGKMAPGAGAVRPNPMRRNPYGRPTSLLNPLY